MRLLLMIKSDKNDIKGSEVCSRYIIEKNIDAYMYKGTIYTTSTYFHEEKELSKKGTNFF